MQSRAVLGKSHAWIWIAIGLEVFYAFIAKIYVMSPSAVLFGGILAFIPFLLFSGLYLFAYCYVGGLGFRAGAPLLAVLLLPLLTSAAHYGRFWIGFLNGQSPAGTRSLGTALTFVYFALATTLPSISVLLGYAWGRFRERAALRRREAEGLCRKCGYDLRGLPSDVCPECGNPFIRTAGDPEINAT